MDITFPALQGMLPATFDRRTDMYNKVFPAIQYTVRNDTNHDLLFKASEPRGSDFYYIRQVYETRVREHMVHHVTNENWTLNPQYEAWVDVSGRVYTVQDSGPLWENVWLSANSILVWVKGDYAHDLQNLREVRAPRPIYEDPKNIRQDALPFTPPPVVESFVPTHPEMPVNTKPINYFAGYLSTPRRAGERFIGGGAAGKPSFIRRTISKFYKSTDGGPKNIYEKIDTKHPVGLEKITIQNLQGEEKLPFNGWFGLPAGETYTVTKHIRTSSVPWYNTVAVANEATFRSYSKGFYDFEISLIISKDIKLSFIHDAGFGVADEMVPMDTETQEGMRRILSLNRSN